MLGYNTAYIIIVICLFLSLLKDKNINKVAYIILAIILVCLCGFRHVEYNYFNDSYIYYQNFLRADQVKLVLWGEDSKDPAFLILTKLIRFFTSNVYIYGFILALITIMPILNLYKRLSPFPFVAIYLYICMQVGGSSPYFMAFNQLRQALAVSFMSIAAYYYIKNNYCVNKNVFCFLIIMILTHWSSLLATIPFFIKKIRCGKYLYIICMIGAAVAGFFAKRFVPQLSELFTLMEQGFFIDETITFSIIHNLPLLLLSCYVFYISSNEECNSFEYKCLFLQFVLYGLLAPFNNSIFRFCIYYGVIGNLAIASSFYKSFKRNNVISIGVAIVSFIYISYVILTSLKGLEKDFPYSIW